MASSVSSVIGGGILGAIGTHVCDKIAQGTGISLGSVLNNTPGRWLAWGLGKVTDVIQYPMNVINAAANRHVSEMDDLDRQINAARTINLTFRTVIAPIYEELAYRGLQIAGGVLLSSVASPLVAQLVSGVVTDIMFGLAHNQDVASDRFISTSSKGVALALTVAMNGLPTSLTEAGIALITSTIAHTLSNLPDAVRDYRR